MNRRNLIPVLAVFAGAAATATAAEGNPMMDPLAASLNLKTAVHPCQPRPAPMLTPHGQILGVAAQASPSTAVGPNVYAARSTC